MSDWVLSVYASFDIFEKNDVISRKYPVLQID